MPFEINEETWHLKYVFADEQLENPVSATINEENGLIKIEIEREDVGKELQTKILGEVRHILRLDENLREFYLLLKNNQELNWIASMNAGRLLRSPTVFEDLIKTICTTNCSWGLTKSMVTNLVEKLGKKTKGGKFTFPTPEAMASVKPEFYRNEVRAGYRSEYLAELSEMVAAGEIDPESWLDSEIPTPELKKEMKRIKGVGNYAAENLLKLVGRYDGLALDSFLRSEFYEKHNQGMECEDKKIREFYSEFGKYRGLAIWFDMTKRWFE